jgi:hypothetical protein
MQPYAVLCLPESLQCCAQELFAIPAIKFHFTDSICNLYAVLCLPDPLQCCTQDLSAISTIKFHFTNLYSVLCLPEYLHCSSMCKSSNQLRTQIATFMLNYVYSALSCSRLSAIPVIEFHFTGLKKRPSDLCNAPFLPDSQLWWQWHAQELSNFQIPFYGLKM